MQEISKLNHADEWPKSRPARLEDAAWYLALFPPVIFVLFAAALALPVTRSAAIWMLSENRPVEMLTFILLLLAGVRGLRLFYRLRTLGESALFYGFYFIFAAGLILTAMEEIAWGQQFLTFQTPLALQEINMQGETTIHNIRGLHGHTEYFRLLFGVGGLIGIYLGFYKKLAVISPPRRLLVWFLVIAAHALVDVTNDIVPIHKNFDAAISWLAELIEFLIAGAAFIYLSVNGAKLSLNRRPS